MMYDAIVSSRSFTIFALWHYEYGPHLVGNSIFDICQPTFRTEKETPCEFLRFSVDVPPQKINKIGPMAT